MLARPSGMRNSNALATMPSNQTMMKLTSITQLTSTLMA